MAVRLPFRVADGAEDEELMARQGHYARIYRAQADLYAMEQGTLE